MSKGLDSSRMTIALFAIWEAEESNAAFGACFAVKTSPALALSVGGAEATEWTMNVAVASWKRLEIFNGGKVEL